MMRAMIRAKDTEERTEVTKEKTRAERHRRVLCVLCSFLCILVARQASGQFQMPDPKQMAGIPRPVDDLPNGAISVRLIRAARSNNIPNHPAQRRSRTTRAL